MSVFEDRYKKLNKEQKAVVDAIEGPVLVVAGPGSGKTEVLSLRAANILAKEDVHPGNVLCLTFTDFAALNMRERLAQFIGRDAYKVPIYTFHSFSVDIINRYPEFFYDGASFLPADELMQMEVLEGILHELPYDNSLKKIHPEQGFTYLKSIKDGITQLKKAGLTARDFREILDSNVETLKFINLKLGIFDERMSAKQIPAIKKLAEEFLKMKSENILGYKSLPKAVAGTLAESLERIGERGGCAPLSQWKERWTKKDENGNRVSRDFLYIEKLYILAQIYEEYVKRMHERGYFDFDDMLLDVLQKLKTSDSLRYELQERFQYILVDEFQDTNDAQMRLLEFLTDAPVHEGRPNIMAVGDDDQAIYKFQGAEISNILSFAERYRDPRIITLVENYRSRQDILDLARHIIKKGMDRLENRISGLRKDLVAVGTGLLTGGISSRSFSSGPHEYHWIAKEIRRLLDAGVEPDHIAIIGRQHKDLEATLPHLSSFGIPVSYERQRNVLREPHVYQLIQMARLVAALSGDDPREANSYLPENLSFPFWGFDRRTIWELTSRRGFTQANKSDASIKNTSLMDALLNHKDPRIRSVGEFFLELSEMARYEPAEVIIDAMVGSHLTLIPDSEDDDESGAERQKPVKFLSPFREYYFGKEKFEKSKTQYLEFLSSLRVFVQALREYKQGQFLKLSDVTAFVDLHYKNNIPITDQSPFVSAASAIRLLTAHKAKGLEFEVVFVLSCEDDTWAREPWGSRLPFPANLPISPAGDTIDDQLRLFYVAITRAKRLLYLTSYERRENGKNSLRLRFLVPGDQEEISAEIENALSVREDKGEAPDISKLLSVEWSQFNRAPYKSDETALLKTLVLNYKMSVTHLNNFLDLKSGGPVKFLEQNLLRFPQAKTVAGSFGSALHRAIEYFYIEFKREGSLPSLDQFLEFYELALSRQRLSERDMRECEKRGIKALTAFYGRKKNQFKMDDRIETDFKNQGVVLGEAQITGKIDLMIQKGGEFEVHDFKTGEAVLDWRSAGDMYEKIKIYKYRRQLVFYKLLVENSRDFGKFKVNTGVLDFLEPVNGKIIELLLEIKHEDVERLTALIEAAYKKIKNLDFPDVGKYSQDFAGIMAFEEDLLKS